MFSDTKLVFGANTVLSFESPRQHSIVHAGHDTSCRKFSIISCSFLTKAVKLSDVYMIRPGGKGGGVIIQSVERLEPCNSCCQFNVYSVLR